MIDWIVGIGTLALFWQQNLILRQQNRIIDKAEGTDVVRSERSAMVNNLARYWPMIAMAILVAFSWSGIIYKHWQEQSLETGDAKVQPSSSLSEDQNKIRRHLENMEYNWAAYRHQNVFGKSFNREEVVLDGKEFRDCTFTDVSLIYEGTAPFYYDKSDQFLRVTFNSDVPVVKLAMNTLFDLGMIGAHNSDTPLIK